MAAVVATLLCGLAPLRAQRPRTGVPLVLDGVTVIDVQNGTRVPGQRVVVVGNRIRAVGRANGVRVPAGARVVDARGKYLIPGLWDMHVHAMRQTEVFYPLFVANGVTGIRDAGTPVPLDTLRLWRREILAGTRVGPPRQILSGPAITDVDTACNRSQWHRRNDPQTCVADAADARHLVDSLRGAGADMIKPRAVGPATYFAIAAEARRLGVPFGGHAEDRIGKLVLDVSDSGARIIDHFIDEDPKGINARCWAGPLFTIFDSTLSRRAKPPVPGTGSVEQCRPMAEHFRRNGTWVVPTLTIIYDLQYNLQQSDGGEDGPWRGSDIIAHFCAHARGFGVALRGNWLAGAAPGAARSAADSGGGMRVMRQVGLPLLAGTDVSPAMGSSMPPGFSLLAELAIYVAEGLTPLEALRTATLNPAKMLHATDSLGTVAAGKLADLVLLDADPLADITNTTTIRAVVANGRYFDRAALDQVLADARAKARVRTIP